MASLDEIFRDIGGKAEEDVLQTLYLVDVGELGQYLNENPIVLHDVLQKRFFDAASLLLTSGASLNQQWGGVSPLQHAATSGDLKVLRFLLLNGAEVSREVWHEDSPFYLAALHGHYEVILQLSATYPSCVKSEEGRSNLFYAACKGGNLDIVKYLYTPTMDLNSPVQLVTSFEDCEHMVPLYAACEGNQVEVGKFLLENEAYLTDKMCDRFPDFTMELSNNYFVQNNKQMFAGRFSHAHLSTVCGLWFEPYSETLTTLDLSHNSLKTLPAIIPWGLPNLQVLNVSYNRLQALNGPGDDPVICLELEDVDLSNNQLEDVSCQLFSLPSLTTLDLSLNHLQHLVRPTHVQPELSWQGTARDRLMSSGSQECEWSLPCLTHLHVQGNKLVRLPDDLRRCQSLTHLNASDNELYSFISPWSCPLHSLNLSDNFLERFPVSVEEFWSGTLYALYLQNNSLDEITESIVKLSELRCLDISNNKIDTLPQTSVWDCKFLETLILSNNCLGGPQPEDPVASKGLRNIIRTRQHVHQSSQVKELEFPQTLSISLQHLHLKNNNLNHVPLSVCRLHNLSLLDISQNPLITGLPRELGLLTHCRELMMTGTRVKDSDIPQAMLIDSCTTELLEHLRKLFRKCQPNNKMKLVVLGPQDKGKSTLISQLQGSGSVYHHGNNIHRTEWKLTARNAFQTILPSTKPDIHFTVWELPGDPDFTILHQCFLSQNALYLLVFDIRKHHSHLQEWLCHIQTRAPKASVILVATFIDKLDPTLRDTEMLTVANNIYATYGRISDCYPTLVAFKSVSCSNKDGIQELKKLIYEKAINISNVHNKSETFLGGMVPRSYRLLVDKIARKKEELERLRQPPILTEEGFTSVLEELPDNEIIALDDVNNVLQHLVEVGVLLHFNEQLEGLNSLYFLNPVWLHSLLSLVALTDLNSIKSSHKIPMSVLRKRFDEKEFSPHLFAQFLQILKRFEIAMETDNDKSLLIPSKLPKEQPEIAADLLKKLQSQKVYRLYKLTYIPPGLWSRFIIRLLKSTERFSHSPWYLNTAAKRESDGRSRYSSRRGLAIKNRDIIYWREGIRVAHEGGYFLVESVNYHKTDSGELGIGILITIVSQTRTSIGLSSIGIIVDELDDILRDYFPSFQDFIGDLPLVYAVCPHCYNPVKDESGIVVNIDHFEVQTCALAVLNKDNITCPQGPKVRLEELVPEMFFKELPKKFFLDADQVTVSENPLGVGAAGAVYSGKLGDIDVAIKMFHYKQQQVPPGDCSSIDSGSASMSTEGSGYGGPVYGNITSLKSTIDEANSVKAYKAFSEVRKEVAILSKLRHPCIVSFLGLLVHPYVYVTMELAKLGSLRSVLDKKLKSRPFNKYQDKHKTYSPVFDRDLTFKILFQVAKGLRYLHEHSIMYRDLKSDNILVCSLDVADTVNVKLSDYGISKFSTTHGLSGIVGTPGYIAPEILNKQTYTEKIDIFSFSMLIYEVLSGHLAYEEYVNLAQIIQAAVKERRRPSLKDFYIVSYLPYLEHMMVECWNHDSSQRPSSTQITKVMHKHQFLAQHEILSVPNSKSAFRHVTCTTLLSEGDVTSHKPQMWIWEGGDEDVDVERRYSIYNLDTSTFHVLHNPCPGSDVRCMVKVGRFMWAGTQGRNIEVYGCHSVGVPQCREQWKLDGIPTSMLFFKKSENEEEQMGHVFVGLDNGTVQIFSHQPNMRKLTKPWQQSKTLTISQHAVSSITLVTSSNELWIACGHTIVIVSIETLLKEDSIDISKEGISKKLCPNPVIDQIVCAEDKVWCSLRKSSKVLEVDVELRQLTYCIDVRDDYHCSYLGGDSHAEDSDIQTDSDSEVFEDTVQIRPRGASHPPVYDRPSATYEAGYLMLESVFESGTQPLPEEAHYETPILVNVKHQSRDSNIYEEVVVGKQLSADEYSQKDRSNSSENVSDETPPARPPKPTIKTTHVSVTPPPRPPKLTISKLPKCDTKSCDNISQSSKPPKPTPQKDTPSGDNNTPPPRPPRRTLRDHKDVSSIDSSPTPPRPPRVTVTKEQTDNDTQVPPPIPSRKSTLIKSGSSKLPQPIPTRRGRTATVPKSEASDAQCDINYLNLPEDTDENKTPVRPPPSPTHVDPPTLKRRPTSDSGAHKQSLTNNNSLEPAPALPPRSKSFVRGAQGNEESNPHTSPKPKAKLPAPQHDMALKTLVSSLLVVEDTLWVGTSKGQIVVVGFQNGVPSTARPKLAEFERPKLAEFESVSKHQSNGLRTGAVSMMTLAGNLVVTSICQTNVARDNVTELAVWKAMGSERLAQVGDLWKKLYKEETELSQRDSSFS